MTSFCLLVDAEIPGKTQEEKNIGYHLKGYYCIIFFIPWDCVNFSYSLPVNFENTPWCMNFKTVSLNMYRRKEDDWKTRSGREGGKQERKERFKREQEVEVTH